MAVRKTTKAAASKPAAKAKEVVKPAAKSKAAATPKLNMHDAIFEAFSEASEEIENALFRSQEMEDVSGFFPDSLVLSMIYHKITSGLYVSSGPEQSAKSSIMATVIGQSLAKGTMIHKHYDVERAMSSTYMGNIMAYHSGEEWATLSAKQTKNGKTVHHPRYRWLLESSLEDVFTEITGYLNTLPDKIYISETGTWRLVFDDRPDTKDGPNVPKAHKILHAKIAAVCPLDNKLSTKTSKFYDIGDDASFQAFYAIDSIKALTLTAIEAGKKGFHQPGLLAKALSDHLPYVKGYLKRKHAVLWCINQMYVNPLEKYGDPVYETAGNALKLHSDVRVIAKPASSVPEPFAKTKGKQGVCTEPSVLGDGSDIYTFKNLKNIKNKFGPIPYLTGQIRIWSSGPNFVPGIDPVHDTASFLVMCGLAALGTSKGAPMVKLATHDVLEGYSGVNIPWQEFKAEILAEVGIGDDEPSELRALCWELITSGKAHELVQSEGKSTGSVAVNHLDDDED
jgi:hypothetical protein